MKKKIDEIEIPEHPFPYPELRPYQKAVFDKIYKKDIPLPSMRFSRQPYQTGIDIGNKDGDKTIISTAYKGHNGKLFIYFDEFSEMPNPRWYRNPIQWYKWHKLWKKIMDIPRQDTYRLEQTVVERKHKKY